MLGIMVQLFFQALCRSAASTAAVGPNKAAGETGNTAP